MEMHPEASSVERGVVHNTLHVHPTPPRTTIVQGVLRGAEQATITIVRNLESGIVLRVRDVFIQMIKLLAAILVGPSLYIFGVSRLNFYTLRLQKGTGMCAC